MSVGHVCPLTYLSKFHEVFCTCFCGRGLMLLGQRYLLDSFVDNVFHLIDERPVTPA